MNYLQTLLEYSAQYFIYALFIYYLADRNYKRTFYLSLIPLAFFTSSSLSLSILPLLCTSLFPFILAHLIMILVFKEMPFSLKSNTFQKRLKKPLKQAIRTAKHERFTARILAILLTVLSLLFVFIYQQNLWLLISGLVLILTLYLFIILFYKRASHVSAEFILLIIGKTKRISYLYAIDPSIQTIFFKDFFDHPIYFIDHVGKIIQEEPSGNTRFHVFILPNDDALKIAFPNYTLSTLENLTPYLSTFEKYHFKYLYFKDDALYKERIE